MPTFLFTDIECSTTLWQYHPREMAVALALHDEILPALISKHGGKVVKHTGDGFFAVFDRGKPLVCALAIQEKLQDENWGLLGELRLRIALHVGEAESRGNDYFGLDVNLTARILEAAWGGQILLSSQAADSLDLLMQASLTDVGVHVLESIPQPQPIFRLSHPSLLLQSFPDLRTQSSHPNNLPQETTPFVGRAEESHLNSSLKIAYQNKIPSYTVLALYGYVYLLKELHEIAKAYTIAYQLYKNHESILRTSQIYNPDLLKTMEQSLGNIMVETCQKEAEAMTLDALLNSLFQVK